MKLRSVCARVAVFGCGIVVDQLYYDDVTFHVDITFIVFWQPKAGLNNLTYRHTYRHTVSNKIQCYDFHW